MQNKYLMKLVLALAVVGTLQACVHRSQYGYIKPGADSDDFYNDLRLCELQNIVFEGRLFFKRRKECMLEEGWIISSRPRAFFPSDYTGSDGRVLPKPPIPLIR